MIREFVSSIRSSGLLSHRRTEAGLFIFALLPQLGFWLISGTKTGNDTSGYVSTCSQWVADPVSLLVSYRGIVNAGFTLPLCALRSLSSQWTHLWVLLQILLFASACVLIYNTGRRLFGYRAGVVSGIALAGLFEAFQWSVYLLTDSLFIFATSVCLWSLSLYHSAASSRSRVIVLASFGLLSIVRPFGIPIVAGWLLLDILPRRHAEFRIGVVPQRVATAGVGFLSVVLAFFIFQVRDLLVDSLIVRRFLEGRLIANDPSIQYSYQPVRGDGIVGLIIGNGVDIVAIFVGRMLLLYVPFLMRHSLLRIGINAVTYLPILLAGVAGAYLLLRSRRGIVVQLLIPVIVTTLIVGVTWIDYDFRYRAPLMPVFSLLAGYAVAASSSIERVTQAGVGRLADR